MQEQNGRLPKAYDSKDAESLVEHAASLGREAGQEAELDKVRQLQHLWVHMAWRWLPHQGRGHGEAGRNRVCQVSCLWAGSESLALDTSRVWEAGKAAGVNRQSLHLAQLPRLAAGAKGPGARPSACMGSENWSAATADSGATQSLLLRSEGRCKVHASAAALLVTRLWLSGGLQGSPAAPLACLGTPSAWL